MKITIIFTLLCAFFLLSCGTANKANQNNNMNEMIVGGDRDIHGCIPSAGQTWCELNQNCIQVFNVGLRLNPINIENNDANISAFVVFNNDKSKVEVFISTNDKSTIILDKTEDSTYKNKTYKFDAKDSSLYINEKKEYQADK